MEVKKVLMVDDEPELRKLGQVSLELVGQFQVVLAASGKDGLAAAACERPDVILLDVMMPGMDGPATLSRLRANPATASIPVIFLTGRTGSDEVARFLGLGAAGVVTKPFDPITLPQEIRRIVASLDKPGPSLG